MIERFLLTLILLSLGLAADDEPFRARIRAEISKDMVLNQHGVAFLPARQRQTGAGIFFQAEQMSALEYNHPEARLQTDQDNTSIFHVRRLAFSFEVMKPGTYQAWYRATYPTNLNYIHAECMDGGKRHAVTDSNLLTPNVWRWSKGPVYHLTKGEHTWDFPSPHAWCGGTKLDCLMLAPQDMQDAPQKILPQETLVQLPQAGEISLRRIKASLLKTWQMTYSSDLNGGDIRILYRYGQLSDWKPVRPGAWESVPADADYLFFRICMTRAKDKLLSPFLYNLKLMVQEK